MSKYMCNNNKGLCLIVRVSQMSEIYLMIIAQSKHYNF